MDNNFIKYNYQIDISPRGDPKINCGYTIGISSGPMTLVVQPFISSSVRDLYLDRKM